MHNSNRLLAMLVLSAFLLSCTLSADDNGNSKPDKPKETTQTKPAKPATHKVEKGLFKIEVTLKGVFESGDATEVGLSALEAWTPRTGGMLSIEKAIEHGTSVRKGESILWLDREKIEQTIDSLEASLEQSAHAIKLAEEELPILEKALPLDIAAAERAKKIADDDLNRFLKEDRPWTEKTIEYSVKRYQQSLQYALEELRQLEKMYKSKDLTEETEEIILKRQRNQVEAMQFWLKDSELYRDQMLNIFLPRREQLMKDSSIKLGLDLQRARATLPLTLSQKRLALTKLKSDQEKAADRLAKLKRDRERLIVKAPVEGIVYHGQFERGKWVPSTRMKRGSMLQGHETLMTVLKSRPLLVRAEVEEKKLRHLRAGLPAKVEPIAFPDLKLSARVDRISAVPVTSEKFDARLTVELSKDAETLMPGMTCTVKVVPYLNQNAVTVPASAVFADDLDETRRHVWVLSKNGKPEKRSVTVGHWDDSTAEIRAGLQAGEEILKEKPSDAKQAGKSAKKGGKS